MNKKQDRVIKRIAKKIINGLRIFFGIVFIGIALLTAISTFQMMLTSNPPIYLLGIAFGWGLTYLLLAIGLQLTGPGINLFRCTE